MANLTVSFNFTPDPPSLPWQRNLGQNWLQLGSTLTHSQCDAGNIAFCNLCCFRCASP